MSVRLHMKWVTCLGLLRDLNCFSSYRLTYLMVFVIGALAAILLSVPSLRIISTVLGILVVVMGAGFIATAVMVKPDFGNLMQGLFIPSFPEPQAIVMVLALIGTTIVPYNLFLGSGLSRKGEALKEMRIGLSVAILLGGAFSMGVLVSGSAIQEDFSFMALASILEDKIGETGKYILRFGLFAAGFTSTVTAPLASAVTLSSLFGQKEPQKWKPGSLRFHLAWMFVLITGVCFASLNLRPVPAIILAQALNGFLLPFVGIFLYMVIQGSAYQKKLKRMVSNLLMLAVIFITLVIGLNSIVNAMGSLLSDYFQIGIIHRISIAGLSLLIVIIVGASAGHKGRPR